ncbi:MAG: hypothetical protein ABXS91_08700 [Sulfurimonas sp.]
MQSRTGKTTIIKIVLPIYYHDGNKKIMIGLNEYERMNEFARNKMKKWYYQMVRARLPKKKIEGSYKAHFMIYYKNSQSDGPNIYSIADKLAIDGLQLYNTLKNDNVLHYLGGSWEVAGKDTDNPRVEIYIQGA